MTGTPIVRLILADADIVAKLANWHLLDRLPIAFDCTLANMATLPSLVHRAQRARTCPDRLFHTLEAADHAWNVLRQMAVAPAPNPKVVTVLQRATDVDGGEAVLIGALCDTPGSALATGDKRALRSLATIDLSELCCGLEGRLFCLEQILIRLLSRMGFAQFRQHIAVRQNVDTSVSMCFGSRFDADQTQVVQGLTSYIADLRLGTGVLLAT